MRRDGLLLFTDARRPSVVGLVLGEPPKGSWFGHPAGAAIYHLGELLEASPQVVSVPLVARKGTLVHRRLWGSLLGIGRSNAPWQVAGLTASERRLYDATETAGRLCVDDAPALALRPRQTRGDLARSLERRLLVIGTSVHTSTGRHAKVLESWTHWRARVRWRGHELTEPAGRKRIEETVARALGESTASTLPWRTQG
ncbi:MAG TPA: hypothetical protein VGS18_05010 [Thermoplasmata archaeon]|nr:hypothetical protein [Thermoplasmata archaeon]